MASNQNCRGNERCQQYTSPGNFSPSTPSTTPPRYTSTPMNLVAGRANQPCSPPQFSTQQFGTSAYDDPEFDNVENCQRELDYERDRRDRCERNLSHCAHDVNECQFQLHQCRQSLANLAYVIMNMLNDLHIVPQI